MISRSRFFIAAAFAVLSMPAFAAPPTVTGAFIDELHISAYHQCVVFDWKPSDLVNHAAVRAEQLAVRATDRVSPVEVVARVVPVYEARTFRAHYVDGDRVRITI